MSMKMIEYLIYTSDGKPVAGYATDYREAIEQAVAQGHPLETLTGMSYRDATWLRGDNLLEKYKQGSAEPEADPALTRKRPGRRPLARGWQPDRGALTPQAGGTVRGSA
jgi:hypothetical protein